MDEAEVITVADHDGWITYYVIPVEIADDIVTVDQIWEHTDSETDYGIKKFRNPIDFAEWHADSDVELTSYWEARHP